MKHIFKTLLVLIFLPALAQAQGPSIARQNLPVVGDSLPSVAVNNQTTWSAGTAGANQTWDFSDWGSDSPRVPFKYEAVSSGSAFPVSDIKLGLTGVGDLYFKDSVSEFYLKGTYTSMGEASIFYKNPQKIFVFPISYSNVILDTAEGSYSGPMKVNPNLPTVDGTNKRTIYSKTEADGYGKLILPGKTYNNVLRVKISSTIKDSVYSANYPGIYQIINSSTEEYFFLSPDFDYQLIYMMRVVSEARAEPIELTFYFPEKVLGNTASLNASGLKVYPNPAKDVLVFELASSDNSDLKLFNEFGVEVKSMKGLRGTSKVDVSDLSAGFYFYEISSKGKSVSKGKVIIK